jgi:peptide/nickel transport system permease protein
MTLLRLVRVPATVVVVWIALAALVPVAMARYAPYVVRPGIQCVRVPVRPGEPLPIDCRGLADLYRIPFADLMVQSTLRSLALLVAAAALAITVGALLGVCIALLRRRVWTTSTIVAGVTLLTAVPAFFVAYFLQVVVIVTGASAEGGRLLPVFGFGYDEHVVLPLLSISLPAIAFTAQLTATRMEDVLDSDFITAANARGLRTSWILGVHVMPHVLPVVLEALGSGLRVSVASLPIVEFLFQWRGIGQLALESVGVHDAATLIFSAVVLTTLFATLSAVADLSRPRALYHAA